MATITWTLYFVFRSGFRYFSKTRIISSVYSGAVTPQGVAASTLTTDFASTKYDQKINHGDKRFKQIINYTKNQYDAHESTSECNTSVNRTVSTTENIDETTPAEEDDLETKNNEHTKILLKVLEKIKIKTTTTEYREKKYRTQDDFGTFCKNLFLKDRKGQFYLIICEEDTQVNLKTLKRKLNAYRNFSFGATEDVKLILKQIPGAVSPFAMLWEETRDVRVIMSKNLVGEKYLNFHPLDPSYTTKISFEDLSKFLSFHNHKLEVLDL